MASTMPEFEMPPPAAVLPQAAPPAPVSPPAPEVSEAERAAPEPPRRGFAWKHLVAACALGLIVGAGVPGTAEVVHRAASVDAVQQLRATALDYVDAIASGDSRRATEMVPIRGLAYIAPPEVLRSARPIELPEVEVVHVEGERGTAEVHYRAHGVDVFRTLQAERIDGAWQLRTTLAEVVDMSDNDPMTRAEIAGVQLGGFLPMLLYPGVYTIDEVEGAVLASGGDVFTVDGDPRTPTSPVVSISVVRAISERAVALATSRIEACWQRSGCLVPHDARLRFDQRVLVVGSDATTRTVDLSVGFMTFAEPGQELFEIQIRVRLDEHDRPALWECGEPGAFGAGTVPCGP